MSSSPNHLAPNDRVVMLSGASKGIGQALARRLLREGFRLSLGVRTTASIAQDILDYGDERVLVCRFDAEEAGTAKPWLDRTLAVFGALDVVINNAGILRIVDFDKGDEADLAASFAVNVIAPFRIMRLAMPHLAKSGHGRIINIASTDGKRYRDSVSVAYAASKHALMAVSHAARFKGWADGIRVTALCPGAVKTDLIAGIPGVMPAKDQIEPDTLADVVTLLLSLPNTVAVPDMVLNTRIETWI